MNRENYRELLTIGDQLFKRLAQNRYLLISTEIRNERSMVLKALTRLTAPRRSAEFLQQAQEELAHCHEYWSVEAPQGRHPETEDYQPLSRGLFVNGMKDDLEKIRRLSKDSINAFQLRELRKHFQGRAKSLLNEFSDVGKTSELTDSAITVIDTVDLQQEPPSPKRPPSKRSQGKRKKGEYVKRSRSSRRNRR